MALVDLITAKLAAIDADIARAKQKALDEVTRLQGLKAPLQLALQKLQADPSLEPLVAQLQQLGDL